MKKMLFPSVIVVLTVILMSNSVSALPRRGFMLESYSINVAKTLQDINNIADLGGTMVRFPIYFSTPNCDLNCWLNFTDAVYETANQRRVNLVIDFHHPGSSPDSTITNVNDFVGRWGIFAQRFGAKGNRVISIWYDLCNEPNHNDWPNVALMAAREIRRYDGHSAIIYAAKGPTTAASTSSTFRPLPGISPQIVEFHFWDYPFQSPDPAVNGRYRYVGAAAGPSSSNYTLSQVQAKLENVRAFGERFGVPVYIGEVGISQGHQDAARFLRDFTNDCDSKGIHLTVHAYRESPIWNYESDGNAWSILRAWLPRR